MPHSPFYVALRCGDETAALKLIDAEKFLDHPDSKGVLPLVYARSPILFKAILARMSSVHNLKDLHDQLLIHSLSRAGEVEKLAALVARGVDLAAVDAAGANALFHALSGGQTSCCWFLRDQGVPFVTAMTDGAHATSVAFWRERAKAQHLRIILDLDLLGGESLAELVLPALRWSLVETLRRVASGSARFDWNRDRPCGFSALHLAVQSGDLALARAMLEQGADPFAQSECGASTMNYAAAGGIRTELFALLAATGADFPRGAEMLPINWELAERHRLRGECRGEQVRLKIVQRDRLLMSIENVVDPAERASLREMALNDADAGLVWSLHEFGADSGYSGGEIESDAYRRGRGVRDLLCYLGVSD